MNETPTPETADLPTDTPCEGETASDFSPESEAPPARKYKVKVDGQEIDVDESELLTGYQTRKASDKRFQEASKLQKMVEEMVYGAKENPKSLLEKLGYNDPAQLLQKMGYDPKELAEAYLMQQLEESLLTPDQKRLRELETENLSFKQRQELEQQQKLEQQKQALQAQVAQELDTEIAQVLKQSGLKPTPRTIRLVAQSILDELDTNADAEEFVKPDIRKHLQKTLQRSRSELKELLENVEPQTLINEFLPPELAAELRKMELEKVRNAPVKVSKESSDQRRKKRLTADDILNGDF